MTTALALLRRWVVEYFNGHNADAARTFIAQDYALSIGDKFNFCVRKNRK